MKILLKVDGAIITATLRDSAAARDFISMLPLALTLEDYARTEKISYLPRKLSKEGAPSGSDASAGDIAYYAPWGNLAIFYKDAGYADGLIILGAFDAGSGKLAESISGTVTIELPFPD